MNYRLLNCKALVALSPLQRTDGSRPAFVVVVISSIILPLAIVFNVLLLLTLKRNKTLRSTSTLLAAGVIPANVFIAILVIPVHIVSHLLPLYENQYFCFIAGAETLSRFIGVTSTVLQLVVIRLDRYMATFKPDFYKRMFYGDRLVAKELSVVWFISITNSCIALFQEDQLLFDVAFCFGSIFLFGTTMLLYIQVVYQTRRVRRSVSPTTPPRHCQNRLKEVQVQRKAIKSAFTTFSITFISYLPLVVQRLHSQFSSTRSRKLQALGHWSYLAVFLFTAANPFLSCLQINTFNQAFMKWIWVKAPSTRTATDLPL